MVSRINNGPLGAFSGAQTLVGLCLAACLALAAATPPPARPDLRDRRVPAVDPAPRVGDPAPQVSALRSGTGDTVDLSKPRRVTVLVFGSHT